MEVLTSFHVYFLASGGFQQCLAILGLQGRLSSPYLHPHIASPPLQGYLSLDLGLIPVQEVLILRFLITLLNTLFSNKSHSHGPNGDVILGYPLAPTEGQEEKGDFGERQCVDSSHDLGRLRDSPTVPQASAAWFSPKCISISFASLNNAVLKTA